MSNADRLDPSSAASFWKGAFAGIAGGLAGAWAMNQFQAALSKMSDPANGGSDRQQDRDSASDQAGSADATVKAAEAIFRMAVGRALTKDEERTAGPAIHYAFGSAMGAVYGATVEMTPAAAAGAGLPFGAVLWLAADELAVPALGLAKPPAEYPVSVHASALAAHLVYGVAADLVRRSVRSLL